METKVKVTFKPLKNGKFRCYVNGIITDTITRNCEAVRMRMYNQTRQQTKATEEKSNSFLTVMTDFEREWNCPHCRKSNQNGFVGEKTNCWYCGKLVKIVGQRPRPQPAQGFYHSWW